MNQIPLIIDTLNDAIRDTSRAIGVKEVARLLWPIKPADEAARYLNDCLNPERPHKLSGEEILAIARLGRERGIHLIIAFANMDAGYAPPQPVDPEDQRAELQRRFNESVATLERLAAQIKRTR
jgi:hypothetical protein